MRARPRIAIGRVWQETNTFAETSTTLEDFRRHRYAAGQQLLESLDGEDDELAGFADVLRGDRVELLPLLAANCWCGGPVEQACVDAVLQTIERHLRAAPSVDGVVFSLHGALAGQETPDVEGAIAALIRREIGEDVPFVLTLDHHANVTPAMVQACDALTAYRHCPHTDMRETGRRGARLLLDLMDKPARPAMAHKKIPLVTPCEQFMTEAGPMRDWFALARSIEEQPGVLDASLFPVQPWLDVPHFGWSVVVTTDGQPRQAHKLCQDLADHAWSHRSDFFVTKLTPSEAVRHAAAAEHRPVVIADGADATNGGSPGDSTCLLREMLAQRITCPAFLTIVDANAALRAWQAGPGARISVDIGASHSRRYHAPVGIQALVVRLSDGRFRIAGHCAQQVDMGRCAVLGVGSIHIVVSEHAGPGHDPEVYRHIGLEPADAQLVVVKCTVGHMQAYAQIMSESLPCECPGPSPSYLERLDYRRIPRPIYPLDRHLQWEPREPTL